MLQLLVALIVLSLVILIHELGHFGVAKLTGVKVEEFGLGYPPRLLGKKIGKTIYSINAVPFGGFVRLFGEQEAEIPAKKRLAKAVKRQAFFHKSKKQRVAVIVAGVVMNFLLGAAAFSLIYSIVGIPEPVNYVVIDAVIPGSPAQQAGLVTDSRVLTLNGQPITQTKEFITLMEQHKGEPVAVVYAARQGKEWGLTEPKTVSVTPRENPPDGEGVLGVLISSYDNIFYPSWQMPFRGAWVGVKEAVAWGAAMVVGIGTMLWQWLREGVAPQVAGPVGIYQLTGQASQQGVLALIKFTGILSINLAVINILPLPALDGGRLAFIVVEKAIGRRVKPAIEQWVNAAGMALLIALMLVITLREVWQLLQSSLWWERLPF